jgi:hypothetical protein
MKKFTNSAALILILAAGALAGCETEGRYDAEINPIKTLSLANGLALYEQGFDRIVYLAATIDGAEITTTQSELFRSTASEDIRWVKGGPDIERPTDLFVLTVPRDERDATRTTSLVRLTVDESPAATYDVRAAYDQLRFGPTGRFAILFRGDSDTGGAGLYNPNEVALVDLSQAPGEANPSLVSLPFGGRRIIDVAFVEESVSIGGAPRQLAVFFVEGAVRIVDLQDPRNIGATVPLVHDDDIRSVTPVQVIARDEAGVPDAKLFIRATGSEDIYEISLTDRGDGTGAFGASINAYQAGGVPRDMLLVEDGDRPLLVILSDAPQRASIAHVVNLNGDDSFDVELGDRVQTASLAGPTPEAEVIVFYGDNTDGVYFLNVAGLYKERDSNLDDVYYPSGVSTAMALENDRLLIIPSDNQDLIILDLLTAKSTRLAAPSLDTWPSAQVHGDRFFFLSDAGDRIDVVDLTTGHPESLLLDDAIKSLHLLHGSGIGLVWHNTPTGRATAFRLDAPDRATSKVVDGVWLDRFLAEKEVTR